MSRRKLPPRLYFNESRGRWVIRYDGWMRRTPFGFNEKADAQKLLDKILGKKSWAHAIRALVPTPRKSATPPWARSETLGWVYFVSTEEVENYPIKIGFCSGGVEKRLAELQIGNPLPLDVIATAPATYAQEQNLHLTLDKDRIGGEWFRRSADVEKVVGAAMVGKLFP